MTAGKRDETAADSLRSPDLVAATPGTAYRAAFGIAWTIFWLLMLLLEIQDHRRQGHADLWRPMLWQVSACFVASLVVWFQWRRLIGLDRWLDRPWQWFARSLAWIPVTAPLFVLLVYSIRHAVYAALGEVYSHGSWDDVLIYECLKFVLFYLSFAAIVFGLRSHAALNRSAIQVERERRLAQQAQLLQLTQQLEPHFLFNALNTISSTIHNDPELADTLLVQLAALLRAATDLTRKPETTLGEEVRLLESYSDIMRQRFGDRVQVRFDIDSSTRGCRVPTLVMQPLIENAFRHGVERRRSPTKILVRTSRAGDRLRMEVEDDAGELPATLQFGTGLTNLQQRLAEAYGDAASIELTRTGVVGVRASIDLPCAY